MGLSSTPPPGAACSAGGRQIYLFLALMMALLALILCSIFAWPSGAPLIVAALILALGATVLAFMAYLWAKGRVSAYITVPP